MHVSPILIAVSVLIIGFGFLYRFLGRPRFPVASLSIVAVLVLFLSCTFLLSNALDAGAAVPGNGMNGLISFITATHVPTREVLEHAFSLYKWADIGLFVAAFVTMALEIWGGLVRQKKKK